MNSLLILLLSICGILFHGNCFPYGNFFTKYQNRDDYYEDYYLRRIPKLKTSPDKIREFFINHLSWFPVNDLQNDQKRRVDPKGPGDLSDQDDLVDPYYPAYVDDVNYPSDEDDGQTFYNNRRSIDCSNYDNYDYSNSKAPTTTTGKCDSNPTTTEKCHVNITTKLKHKFKNFTEEHMPKNWTAIKTKSSKKIHRVETIIRETHFKQKFKNVTHPFRYRGCKHNHSDPCSYDDFLYLGISTKIHPKSSHVEVISTSTLEPQTLEPRLAKHKHPKGSHQYKIRTSSTFATEFPGAQNPTSLPDSQSYLPESLRSTVSGTKTSFYPPENKSPITPEMPRKKSKTEHRKPSEPSEPSESLPREPSESLPQESEPLTKELPHTSPQQSESLPRVPQESLPQEPESLPIVPSQSLPQEPLPESLPQELPETLPQELPESLPQELPEPLPQEPPEPLPQEPPEPLPQEPPEPLPQEPPEPLPQELPEQSPQEPPEQLPQEEADPCPKIPCEPLPQEPEPCPKVPCEPLPQEPEPCPKIPCEPLPQETPSESLPQELPDTLPRIPPESPLPDSQPHDTKPHPPEEEPDEKLPNTKQRPQPHPQPHSQPCPQSQTSEEESEEEPPKSQPKPSLQPVSKNAPFRHRHSFRRRLKSSPYQRKLLPQMHYSYPRRIKVVVDTPDKPSEIFKRSINEKFLVSAEDPNNSTHVLEAAGEVASDLAGRVSSLWHSVVGIHHIPDLKNIRFYLYTRRNVIKPELLKINFDLINRKVRANPHLVDIDCTEIAPENIPDFERISDKNREIIKSNYLNIRAPTKILIHGYTGSYRDSRMAKIKDAYLNSGRYNVIQVDWEELAAPPCYIRVTHHSKFVGETIAQFLDGLHLVGLNMSLVHLVGFSLGAQVAGFAGNNATLSPVCRITGLDPALPLFLHTEPSGHLDKADAKFVDVIHTCGGILAMLDPLGHVDFYPNGGTRQPGCEFSNLKCSHSRAPQYFAESVVSKKKFKGQLCYTWEDFVKGGCNNITGTSYMGEPCSRRSVSGKYYLLTKSREPFVL